VALPEVDHAEHHGDRARDESAPVQEIAPAAIGCLHDRRNRERDGRADLVLPDPGFDRETRAPLRRRTEIRNQ